MYTRYGVYFTPPEGPFANFGAAWLGWDVARGKSVPHVKVDGLDVTDITQTPRKYGFHGTIKPPFYLAEGKTAPDLFQTFETLCKTLPRLELQGLELARLGQFMALVPLGDTKALADLAGKVVQGLDPFRAPPSEAELARRRAANLTPEQDKNLQRWGYPYVFDAFRFHMTLTSKLDPSIHGPVQTALAPLLAQVLPKPLVVNSLTMVGQRRDGMFEEIHRQALTG